jgi:membrane peptidoglycan carboxypeptidase
VPASRLDARQAVLLAAVIINPRRYSPLEPGRRIERRARMIAGRMRRRGYIDAAQYQVALGAPPPVAEKHGFLGWFFGGHTQESAPPAEATADSGGAAAPADTAEVPAPP